MATQPKIEIKGSTMVITADLGKEALAAATPSSTGKTRIVCGTGGFVGVNHPTIQGLKAMLNITVPND